LAHVIKAHLLYLHEYYSEIIRIYMQSVLPLELARGIQFLKWICSTQH